MGGFKNVPPGRYHVSVQKIEVQPEKHRSSIVVDVEILKGTVPGQEGNTAKCFLWYDPDNEKWQKFGEERVSRFFWAAGLVGDNAEADVNPTDATGRQLVIEIEEKTEDGKTRVGYQGSCWPLEHSDVSDVPKDEKALAYQGASATSSQGQAGDSEEGAGATAGASDDLLSGIL